MSLCHDSLPLFTALCLCHRHRARTHAFDAGSPRPKGSERIDARLALCRTSTHVRTNVTHTRARTRPNTFLQRPKARAAVAFAGCRFEELKCRQEGEDMGLGAVPELRRGIQLLRVRGWSRQALQAPAKGAKTKIENRKQKRYQVPAEGAVMRAPRRAAPRRAQVLDK